VGLETSGKRFRAGTAASTFSKLATLHPDDSVPLP
jgi:hypothetical protein